MKKFYKLLLFCAIFLFIYSNVSLLLIRKGNGFGTDVLNFYQQKRDSIDILVLGSSHAYAAFSPEVIFNNTKMKVYDFATQQQPIWITYYYLIEALKYQKPKYVFLEVHMAVASDYEYASESVNRDAIDKMRFSVNKINAINNSVKFSKDRYSYYFNIAKYHSRYKELNKDDFDAVLKRKTIDNNGHIDLENIDYIFSDETPNNIEEKAIHKKSEEYLYKIIDLLNKKGIKLILVKTPCSYNENEVTKLNYTERIMQENDILFLNYIKNISDLNLDYKKDFYDSGHLSESGSEKLSTKISEIINKLEVEND